MLAAMSLQFVAETKSGTVQPGYHIQPYAVVTDPMAMSFDRAGNLFVGRDNIGSGGGHGDAVRIHQVSWGGASVVEYGDVPIPDPDMVLVDEDGTVSGTPGAVLVGGNGYLWAVLPDESIELVFNSSAVGDVNGLTFDARGELIVSGDGGIFELTGASPALLNGLGGYRGGSVAVDATARIFASVTDATLKILDRDGTLLDAAFAASSDPSPDFSELRMDFGNGGRFGTDLYAIDGAGDLYRLDAAGNTTKIGSDFGVAFLQFGPDRALYVSERDSDLVSRITVAPEPAGLVPLVSAAVTCCGAAWCRSAARMRRQARRHA
jgi:hypothetical protein